MAKTSTVLLIGAEDEENLAVRTLAGFLESRGVAAQVVGFSSEEQTGAVLGAVRKTQPDIVAVSIAFQSLSGLFFRLVQRIRAQGYAGHVVVGGHFPTFEYRKILETQQGIDSVGRFEGEQSLARLAEALGEGGDLAGVPNLVYRAGGGIRENACIHEFPDVDRLPFPVRTRKAQVRLGERFATLVSSRGCWHCRCAYCCIGAFHRGKRRSFVLRSAENVAEELAWLTREKRVRLFQFHDDNFVLPSREATSERVRDLVDALGKKGVKTEEVAFLIKARPDTIDEEVARELSRLGCVGVFLGIENACESGLDALMRGVTPEDIRRAVEALRRHGMIVTYNLLMFHPHATPREIEENIAFAKARPELPFDFGRAEIVAGSPLETLVIKEGKLRGTWPHWDYVMDDPTVERMFQINMKTFRAKDSTYSSLMHSLIALSYHGAAMNRLHPGPATSSLVSASGALVIRANRFIVECLQTALDLARAGAGDAEVARLHAKLKDGCTEYRREVLGLTNRMLRLQVADRVFGFFNVRQEAQGQRILWRLLGCRARPA